MSLDLGRRLQTAGVALPGELRRAVFDAITTGKPFARALADASVTVRALLDKAVEAGDHPAIRAVIPHPELVAAMPAGLPARLLIVPVRRDARTGTVDLACVDPLDAHAAAEASFHLGTAVRMIAAPLAEIERALLLIKPPQKEAREEKDPLSTTADYEAAPPPEPRAVVAPITTPQEDAVPLVRRARVGIGSPSLPPPEPRAPTPAPSEPPASAIPLSRTRVSSASPPDRLRPPAPPVQMVVDFRAAARQERDEIASETPREKLAAKRPPFASLTRILEVIDVARDRGALIEALLQGLATTATAGALFAPRRGKFVGIGAIGQVDPERVRSAVLTPAAAVADALVKNERLGTLDPIADADLHWALGLERFTPVHVLIHPSFVADRAALLLVAIGMGDVLESSRRARVLATAASAALERLLRRQ